MLRVLLSVAAAAMMTCGSAHALTGERILRSPEWFVMTLASKMEQHAKCQLSDTEMLDIVIGANDLHDFVSISQRGASFEVRNRIDRSFNGIMVFTNLSTSETTTATLLSTTKSGNDQYLTVSARNVSAEAEWYEEMLVIDPAAQKVGPHSNSDQLTLERDYACTFSPAEEVRITAQEPIRRAVSWCAMNGTR